MGRREKPPMVPQDAEIPLGAKIRARRWRQGMSLSQLASAVGDYDQSHLSHIENGRDIPSAELLRAIADTLAISVAELQGASYEVVTSWLNDRSPTVGKGRRQFPTQQREAAPAPSFTVAGAVAGHPGRAPAALGTVKTSVAYPRQPMIAAMATAPFETAPLHEQPAPAEQPAPSTGPTAGLPSSMEVTLLAVPITARSERATTEALDVAAGTEPPPMDEAPTEITPEILARVADILGTTPETLEGASEEQLVAWLDDPASFAAARAAALPTAAVPEPEAAPAAAEEAPTEITPEILAQVAGLLGATVEELAGASEEQLVAWLDDPASFAAARAAGTLPAMTAASATARTPEPDVGTAAAAPTLAPEMLAIIAQTLGATPEELAGVPYEQLLEWMDNPSLFEQARRGVTPSPPQVVAPQPVPDQAETALPPQPSARPATPVSGEPASGLSAEQLAMLAMVLGTTVEELHGASNDELLEWLADPERYHQRRNQAPAPTPAPPAATLEVPVAAVETEQPLSPELLAAVAQALGADVEDLRRATQEQLLAWLDAPDTYPGPRRAAAATPAAPAATPAVAAPAAAVEEGEEEPPETTAPVHPIIPENPAAFQDEYQISRMSTAEKFRRLRELTAHERLGDRPEVLNPLLQRMHEAEQYQEQVKARAGILPSAAEPPNGPRRVTSGRQQQPTPPPREKKEEPGGLGGWLRGLFGGASSKDKGKRPRR